MIDDIKPHIIGITESWANNDITNAELGLEGYVMFRKDRIGRRGGGILLYIKDTIPAYEVQLQEKAYCNEGFSTMFPGSYVPRYLCSPNLCFPVPMFPGTYVPRYRCSRYLYFNSRL